MIDVDKYRTRTGLNDGLDGSNKGHRGGYHFIARPNLQGEQRQTQRVGATADGDYVADPQIFRKLRLKSSDLGPGYVRRVEGDCRELGGDRFANLSVLRG